MTATLGTGQRPRMDPRIARRRVEVRREEGRRRLRVLIGCASAAAVVCLLAASLWTPLFKVRHVRVAITPAGAGPGSPSTDGAPAGSAQVSAKQVVAAAGFAKQRLMIDVSASATARRLDAVALLGAAHVSVDWPGTVVISVAVRRPVAQVPEAAPPARQGGAPRWATLDATGRVLWVSTSATPGLPVIYGAGPVPATGSWMAGTAGPSAPVGPSAGKHGASPALVDMNAQSDGTDIPSGLAAALAVAAALPSDIEGDVQSISVAGSQATITMAVQPRKVAAGSIKVVLGDGSQLDAKLTSLYTLLTQADLNGVRQLDLTVPDRPAALAQAH